jgi:hypothetical protein
MMLKLFSVATLGIAATNAMLIVPEYLIHGDNLGNLLPFDTLAGSQSRSVNLPCPSCPFGEHPEDDGTPNHLVLNILVDSSSDETIADRLLVNGFEIFPNPSRDRVPSAAQVLSSDSDSDSAGPRSVTRKLGFRSAMSRMSIDDDGTTELLELEFHVIALGRDSDIPVLVEGVPVVEMRVIRQAEGGLILASLETKYTDLDPLAGPSPPEPAAPCLTRMCHLQKLVSQRLANIRSGINNGGHSHGDAQSQEGGHGRPGGRRPRTFRQLMRHFASHILLPVAIGVVAGVSASIIGMIIGTFAVCLWRVAIRYPGSARTTLRRHRRHNSRRTVLEEKKALDDEKTGLITAYIAEEDLHGDDSI